MPTEQTSEYMAAHGCHFIVCSLCFLIVIIINFALRSARTALYKTGPLVVSRVFFATKCTNNSGAVLCLMCFFVATTFVGAAGEAGDDGDEFGGVDGFGEVELEAGTKDAHPVFGACIRSEGGCGNLSTTLGRQRADLRDQGVTIFIGHPEIADEDVWLVLFQCH